MGTTHAHSFAKHLARRGVEIIIAVQQGLYIVAQQHKPSSTF